LNLAQVKLNPIHKAKEDLIGWWKVNDNSERTFIFMNISEVDSTRIMLDFTDKFDPKTGISNGWDDVSEIWTLKIKSDTLFIKNDHGTPDEFPFYRKLGNELVITEGKKQTQYVWIKE